MYRESVIEAQNIFFSYGGGEQALREVSFTIGAGEFVGILGPNGSGKTTLIKVLSGIVRPNEGRLKIMGQEINTLRHMEIARRISVVPQHTHIEFPILGLDVVVMGRYPHRARVGLVRYTHEDYEVAAKALATLDASHLAHKEANNLSGGETSLLAIARAMAQETPIVLADEATSSLDPRRKVMVFELLWGLNRDQGLTVVTVMHDINLAAMYCSRLLFLKDGALVLDGEVEEVLTRENLMSIYNVDVEIVRHPRRGVPQVLMG